MPVGEYNQHAIEQNNKAVEERYEPDGSGWLTPVWEFTRMLKGHPDLQDVCAQDALAAVEEVFDYWAKTANKSYPEQPNPPWTVEAVWEHEFHTAAYECIYVEDFRMELLSNWDQVRYIPGWTPLENALSKADEFPLGVGKDELTSGYERFVSLAGWLQVTMGDRAILLPCHKLAEVLGVQPMTISRYRRAAIAQGFLRQVKPHKVRARATEFRFDVSQFECLTDAAKPEAVGAVIRLDEARRGVA